jgi:hypothetical protein
MAARVPQERATMCRLLKGDALLCSKIDAKLVVAFNVLETMFTDFINHYVDIATDDPFPYWL